MKFEDRLGYLNLGAIEEMNRLHKSIELNNVLEGFQKQFFAISLINLEDEIELNEYMLIYIGNFSSIRGLTLRTGRKVNDRDLLTFQFSKAIEDEFEEPNQLVIFNTFQEYVKYTYENQGIVCLPDYISDLNKTHTLEFVLPHKRDIDRLLRIDILEFYRSFFERQATISNEANMHKIYLMYDYEYKAVKIGKTKQLIEVRKKGVAEPTLRAAKQEIYPIVVWQAPPEMETELKSKFHKLRLRGEWFDFRPKHLNQIDKIMSGYKLIDF